jgi:hypothetical protein
MVNFDQAGPQRMLRVGHLVRTNDRVIGRSIWRHAVLALVLNLAGHCAWAQTGPMDFLFSGSGAPRAGDTLRNKQRVWKVGEYTAVVLQAADAGSAPNRQPVRLNPDTLRNRLAGVEFRSDDRTLPLFSADELKDIVPTLVQALTMAGPGDDLLLLSTARRESGLIGLPMSITARLFMADGQLNLIVDSARQDTLSLFRAARMPPKLNFGSRATASLQSGAVALSSRSGQFKRADWLQLPVIEASDRDAPMTVPGSALLAPPAPAGQASQAPATGSRDNSFYEEQARRLKGLQSLRDQGLLTEAELQDKRREILQGL